MVANALRGKRGAAMTVDSIGDLVGWCQNGKLPRRGIIISASKEELMAFNVNLLFREVDVIDATIAKHYANMDCIRSLFDKQIGRCAAICGRLDAEPTRTYSHDDVIAIIDELLDGIKPKKGRATKNNIADVSRKIQEALS